MDDNVRSARRRPFPPGDDWEDLHDMINEYRTMKANRKSFYRGILLFGGIATILAPFHDWIASGWSWLLAAIRGH